MRGTLVALATVLFVPMVAPAADMPPAEEQIAAAVLAAPAEYRGGAAVLGYHAEGALVTLRAGSNEFVCLGDDPRKEGFNASCYHKDLEPYMARGRELAAQGVTGQKRNDVRWKEIGEGKLAMQRQPRTLYVLTGKGFDAAAGQVNDPYLRWVIYIPYATPESTGLSTKATANAPWLMYPGTAGAHIMISPEKHEKH